MINKNQECDIISDLLPLYLEEKVSAESGEFVEEHLAGCAECRKNLELMGASYEELLSERMRKGKRKRFKKSRVFGKARGRLFVYGYLFFLLCWWVYIIACYV